VILITGGFGYLGGRLAKRLVSSGKERVVLGTREISPKIQIELMGCEVVQMKLDDHQQLISACNNIETIIHLAGMNAPDCKANPEQAFLINSTGTRNLLKAASISSVKNFIYFSTAHIYGSPLQGIINESTVPNPIHPYAVTHKRAEEYVLEFDSKNLINGIVLRLSNGIGAPLDINVNCWMLAANIFCRQAVIEHKINVTGSSTERDFIPITSVEDLIEFIIKNPSSIANQNIMNVGSGVSMSIYKLSNLIAERCLVLFNFSPEIKINDTHEEKIAPKLKYVCDIYEKFGIGTTTTLSEEIDNLLLFCDKKFNYS
tara:strand:+ start:830 stop:1777 length:948 start_codon:yes stop_codon:yes gene_type:complete